MSLFKSHIKNRYKDKCLLGVGSSFIFNGYYCIVIRMFTNGFRYIIQENESVHYMSYEDYLKTPSAAGRRLNK